MKKILLVIILSILIPNLLNSQPTIEWAKCYGGSEYDYFPSIQQTNEGGYIIAGISSSNDGDISGHHGSEFTYDYWIIKLNSKGDIQWQKSLGGSGVDEAESIQQTSDGGYIVAGSSSSRDGDVSGNHGADDFWIVKLNPEGSLQWQKSLGDSSFDQANSIQQTKDNGYIVAGCTQTFGGDIRGHHGYVDYWIVKINSVGDIQWSKCLGGRQLDIAYSIEQTNDDGYIIAGISSSNEGDVSGHHGTEFTDDYWIVKLNSIGDIQWQKSIGGSGHEPPYSIQQTSDAGYIIVGWTNSNDGDASGNHGGGDIWIVKLNTKGSVQWQKCVGGSTGDMANSIQQTKDGGFIVAGSSKSNDGDVSGHHGEEYFYDYWIVKLNSKGDIQWQKSMGGEGDDYANSIKQTSDGGYIVAGYTESNDGDVSGNHGKRDYWIVKLSPDTVVNEENNSQISISPNPAQDFIFVDNIQSLSIYNIQIFNLIGMVVKTIESKNSGTQQIDLSDLFPGVYIIKINNQTKMFIKE